MTENQTAENVSRLINEISVVRKPIIQQKVKLSPQLTRVLLVGIAGVGKTTLMHALVGILLTGNKDNCGRIRMECEPSSVLKDSETNRRFEMGGGINAVTFEPNMYVNGDMVYYDCPGFMDPDPCKRVINAFTIDEVLSGDCQVKILLVATAANITEANGYYIKNAVEVLGRMFPDKDQLSNALGVVISQGNKTVPAMTYLNEWKAMPAFFKKVVSNPERVFAFPEADDQKTYVLTDKDKLISFIRESPVRNPQHVPGIDDAGETIVYRMIESLCEQKKSAYKTFMNTLWSEIGKNITLEKIASYKKAIEALIDAASQSNHQSFTQECKNLTKVSTAFSEPYKKLQEVGNNDEIAKKLMELKISTSDEFSYNEVQDQLRKANDSLLIREEKLITEKKKKEDEENLKKQQEENARLTQRVNNPPVQHVHVYHGGGGGGCCIM